MCSNDATWIDDADARLLEHLHGGFPLVDRPFAQVADELDCSEDEVLERLSRMLAQGVLTRFGPLFQIERAGGCFVLAAMAVPEARFDAVADAVNAWPEVAHNYCRESAGRRGRHAVAPAPKPPLNMWFVVAAESPAAAEAVLQHIEADTGLAVLRLPKEREFVVELKLPIGGSADGPV
jgi:DNA-binding Lrp family transcriptional regulator